ncbi:MAG: hypothetical protein WA726_01280 [Acidimicrobiia bacterium]
MSESTLESMIVATKTAYVVVLLATGLILALAVVALTRRTVFAARASRVLLSLLSVGGFLVVATVSFEKIESTTPAYRRYISNRMGPEWWDLLLSLGSIAVALGAGLLVVKLLEGKPPRGWGGTSARIRDWGLLTLLTTSVALFSLPDPSGPRLMLFDDTIRFSLWGLWGLAIAVPVAGLLVRRLRTPPPMILSRETGRFGRYSRRILAVYYWVVALGVPTAVVAGVAANNGLMD